MAGYVRAVPTIARSHVPPESQRRDRALEDRDLGVGRSSDRIDVLPDQRGGRLVERVSASRQQPAGGPDSYSLSWGGRTAERGPRCRDRTTRLSSLL